MAASLAKNVLKGIGRINHAFLPQVQTVRDSRLGKPLYLIYVDYKNVFLDFCRFVYKKPLRAVLNFTATGTLVGVWYLNPDPESYTSQLMENANTLLLLSDKVRNPNSNESIQRLLKLHDENRLKVYNFGFFSLVRKQEYCDGSCFYEARCYYLKERWLYLYKNIIDVGFLGKWFFLEKAMVDYDVNETELSGLQLA